MIVSRTPLRISLVGGGTDLPSFYEKTPGVCISFAINKYVYVMLNEKCDGRFRISYSKTENVNHIVEIKHPIVRDMLLRWGWSKRNPLEIVSIADIPGEGSGLGSSSSFTVGLLNAIWKYIDKEESQGELASQAFLEELASHPHIGKQDHFAAALGGFNKFSFMENSVTISPVECKWDSDNHWSQSELTKYMLLLYTGITRKSDDILKAQKENFSSGNTIAIGEVLVALANTFYTDLVEGNIQQAAKKVSAGWDLKKKLAPGISNEWVDDWYSKAMNNGAWGGKLCGAGGGGFLFFFAPPDTHDRIVKATGLRKIDFKIENEGSVIIKREGYGEF